MCLPQPEDLKSLHTKLQEAGLFMYSIYSVNTFVHILKVSSALEQTDGPEVEVQIQKMHLFFNCIFFPAVERKLKLANRKKQL